MSRIENTGMGTVWKVNTTKKNPAVQKTKETQESEEHQGSENPSRETSDFSEKQKSKTQGVYNKTGKIEPLDDDHPRLDEMG
ncbi:MAG: hypothetical protein COA45_05675 [Zetaproteobacteria bacterium]|nr:MAG: hypothetical protein COA45_05675 [Zetaproteobacteria bacterium]